METAQLRPLSGFNDRLDATRPWIINQLAAVFRSFGYQALDSPIIERQEILLNKLGSEGQKQLYLFEDNGGRLVGLRYDLTVPLARYVAGNLGKLTLPFKRYEIAPAFRAEKPQRGRGRQFTQADIDIVGEATLGAEKEILEVIRAVEQRLGQDWTVLINDRRLIGQFLIGCGVPKDKLTPSVMILDKKGKMSNEKLLTELEAIVGSVAIPKLSLLMKDDLTLQDLAVESSLKEPVAELVSFGRSINLTVKFSPSMVRGLEYYTGVIMELSGSGEMGSLGGGGRYDNLIATFGVASTPAVGFSFGVDRLSEIVPAPNPPKLFIANLPSTENESREWAKKLRGLGWQVTFFLESKGDLGRQIKYAASCDFTHVILPLEGHWERGAVKKRDLTTGDEEIVLRTELETNVG